MDTSKTQNVKPVLAGIGAFIAFAAWTGICLGYLMPALWGPYAMVFADAGPLFISRGGSIMALGVMPWLALALPLAKATSFRSWLLHQLMTLGILGAMILSYGYYLHQIVHLQGVEASQEFLAGEVGFESAAAVPDHIQQALKLSDKLASEGRSPWLPGAWKSVTWPAIPERK